ncbi:glycosyltransferase [candidate division KSB1 bacterium]|nr:glycosyltransferase [candidate division KSB1 bacterium]
MKVGLIGPIHPFRNGEAQSNTMLCENLSERHEVVAFSFKRQYPNFLYPGKSQLYNSPKKLNFRHSFLINTMNPLNWLYAFFKIKKEKLDVVIVTWYIAYLAPCYVVLMSLMKLFSKTQICIFAHNVSQHEENILNKILTWPVLALGDYFIVFSSKTEDDLKQIFPDAKVKILVETTYDNHFKQKVVPAAQAREKLKIKSTDNVALFFGLVRPYKGVKYLIEAIPHVLKKVDVKFYVVGEFWEDIKRYRKRIAELKIEDNITIVDQYVSDEEAIVYFSATDLFVLPYVSATYSAVIPLAYGYNKPVIVSDVLGLTDLVDDGQTGYIVPPQNPEALAEKIVHFFAKNKQDEFVQNVKEKKKIFQWSKEKDDVVFHGILNKL